MSSEKPFIHAALRHRNCKNCANYVATEPDYPECKAFVSAYSGEKQALVADARRRSDLCGQDGTHFIAVILPSKISRAIPNKGEL